MPEVRSEDEKQVSPMLKEKIVDQIEYYFGDFNMMKDKFMKLEVTKDNGWVPISVLTRFNRLAALTKEQDVILSAFKEHPSDIVEVDYERKCIRRNPVREVPEHDENWRNSVAQRSIYIKGFPVEIDALDELIKFMQTFGKIDNVFKRCYFDKTLKKWTFKGSAFVCFPTKEDAEKFMSIKSVKYAGEELIRKWQLDYIEEKKAERLQMKAKMKETKDQLLEEQKAEITKEMKKLPTGALIRLTGLVSNISMGHLKNNLITNLEWDVAFVDYSVGESEAYVRLQEENSAKSTLEKLTDKSFEIDKVKITAELVEGEKETEVLNKMESDKNCKVLQNMMKGKKGKKIKGKKKGKQDRNEEMLRNADIKSKITNMPEKPSSSTEVAVKSEPMSSETNMDTSSKEVTSSETNIDTSSKKVTAPSESMSSEANTETSSMEVIVKTEPVSTDTSTDASSLKRKIDEGTIESVPNKAVKKPKAEPNDE